MKLSRLLAREVLAAHALTGVLFAAIQAILLSSAGPEHWWVVLLVLLVVVAWLGVRRVGHLARHRLLQEGVTRNGK